MSWVTLTKDKGVIQLIAQEVLDFESQHGHGISAMKAENLTLAPAAIIVAEGDLGHENNDHSLTLPIQPFPRDRSVDVLDIGLLLRPSQILGGITYRIFNDWLLIDHGFVWEPYRQKGVYKTLMQELEYLAWDWGLSGIYVRTYEWEAPAVYEALGFTRNGVLHNFPKGNTSIEYIKEFEVS